jgi:hypothetical protein
MNLEAVLDGADSMLSMLMYMLQYVFDPSKDEQPGPAKKITACRPYPAWLRSDFFPEWQRA